MNPGSNPANKVNFGFDRDIETLSRSIRVAASSFVCRAALPLLAANAPGTVATLGLRGEIN
jgi:hypothetical protein